MRKAYLREVRHALIFGGVFYTGKTSIEPYPILWAVLDKKGELLVHWVHFGASANPINELGRVIRGIYGMTPKQFLETYECRYNNECIGTGITL